MKLGKVKSVLISFSLCALVLLISIGVNVQTVKAQSMPYYDLRPSPIVVRSEFSTDYSKSSQDRKTNISLACKSLNNVFVDVGGEFSFNKTVGPRTESRGYKNAKIIVKGEFVDGVGGGVCQVSTTLYNALLLAGLKIIEYHPHSLPVSYIEPSFDAMVNSGSADLRFINDTHNPVIIKSTANGNQVKFVIMGEKLKTTITRQSAVTDYLPVLEPLINIDNDKQYPDLYVVEKRIISYGKQGYKSTGKIIKSVNGKIISQKIIRKDSYASTRGVVVIGTAERQENQLNLGK